MTGCPTHYDGLHAIDIWKGTLEAYTVLTACRNGVVSSTAQVGKAGSKTGAAPQLWGAV